MCEVLGESRTCSLDHLGSAKCGLGHDKFYGRGLLAIAAETSEIRERSIHGDIQLSQLDDTGAPPKMIVIGCIFGGPTIAIFVCCSVAVVTNQWLFFYWESSLIHGIHKFFSFRWDLWMVIPPTMENYCDFMNDQIACTMVKPPIEYDLTDLTIDDLKHSTLGRHN